MQVREPLLSNLLFYDRWPAHIVMNNVAKTGTLTMI